MKKILFYGLPRIAKAILAITLKPVLWLVYAPREAMIEILKRVYGCKIYVPKGKNRMGNKQYKLR